ncbi:MAG: EF-hand domain-containing protein [Planctomycetota bacterium]
MRRTLALLAALATLAPLAAGQDPGARRRRGRQATGGSAIWKMLVKKYDKNQDGEISRSEHGRTDAAFQSLDRDGDGVLTEEDFATGGGRRGFGGARGAGVRGGGFGPARMLGRVGARGTDTDRNGKISKKEWQAFAKGFDGNGDLVIDAEELGKKLSFGRARRSPRGGGQLGGGMSRFADMMLERLDADQDGEVQVKEIAGLFLEIDADENGSIDSKELGTAILPKLPVKGDPAPDFTLAMSDDPDKTVTLSSFAGKKPVALIFGSYT